MEHTESLWAEFWALLNKVGGKYYFLLSVIVFILGIFVIVEGPTLLKIFGGILLFVNGIFVAIELEKRFGEK